VAVKLAVVVVRLPIVRVPFANGLNELKSSIKFNNAVSTSRCFTAVIVDADAKFESINACTSAFFIEPLGVMNYSFEYAFNLINNVV